VLIIIYCLNSERYFTLIDSKEIGKNNDWGQPFYKKQNAVVYELIFSLLSSPMLEGITFQLFNGFEFKRKTNGPLSNHV